MIIDDIIKRMKDKNIPVNIKREDILKKENNKPYVYNKYRPKNK